MKTRWNNKVFPVMNYLNFINGKPSPYGSKGVLIHYHYSSDPKLGLGIVTIRRITYTFHDCRTILYLTRDYKIKEAFNQPKYGRVYNCKYSIFFGSHNNWIVMNSLYYLTYNV